MTPKQYTKLYRKVYKDKWYTANYDGSTFSYRIISFGDMDIWNDRIHILKLNIEVKDYTWNERRIWGKDDKSRNRSIRGHFFYYQENVEANIYLKLFGLDSQNLKVNTIKIK